MTTQQIFDFLDPQPVTSPSERGNEKSQLAIQQPLRSELDNHDLDSKQAVLRQLRAKAGCISTASNGEAGETLSTGSDAIDSLLPRGGLRFDAITEWVSEADGCGAAALAMITAATYLNSSRDRIASSRGPLVVVSNPSNFYPPAAVALGIPASRIIWVRPTRHVDLVWSIDQALRCQSVAAVWAHIGANLDDRDARRFQLAAEAGRTPGLFIRPAAARGRPSFADVRLHIGNHNSMPVSELHASEFQVRSQQRVMKVMLDRCRGGTVGHSVWIQIDDQARVHKVTPQPFGISENETAAVRLASELAHPKTPNRKASRRRA
jgi:protein ImuA